MAKKRVTPKARKAWFIVMPSGLILPWSGRSIRSECIIDYTLDLWGKSWDDCKADGVCCIRCDVRPVPLP